MFGIINSTLRIASRSENTAETANRRDDTGRNGGAKETPAKLRFRSQSETDSLSNKF